MKIYIIVFALFSAMSFTGCVETSEVKPEKKIEISLLNEQVKELDAKDKQLIYRSIQDDINKYNEKGDEAYENGYNSDAIIAYELVNFYEGYNIIPVAKIKKIKKIAKQKSKYHYIQALKYSSSNKKRAVAEFNKVMMNNPNYKDSAKRLKRLKNDREIKILINSLDSSLQTKCLNSGGNIDDLKGIYLNLYELLKYDYKNKTALKARRTLGEYHSVLVNSGVEIYKSGNITKAEKKFNAIISIYKNDPTSIKYLNKIKITKEKQLNLRLAKKALKNARYIESIKYANKVLNIDHKNTKAKEIKRVANIESKKRVTELIIIGKRQYNNKDLDKANQSFKEALDIDPHNNTSLIYAKKIHRQLDTIKSSQ